MLFSKVHHRVHKSPPQSCPEPVQFIYSLSTFLCRIHFNIILPTEQWSYEDVTERAHEQGEVLGKLRVECCDMML